MHKKSCICLLLQVAKVKSINSKIVALNLVHKKSLVFSTLFLFSVLLSAPFVSAEPKFSQNPLEVGQVNSDVVPGQFIVILKNGASPNEFLETHGVGKLHLYDHALNGVAITASSNQLTDILSDPNVAYVEHDTMMKINAQTIPTGISRMEATQSFVAPVEDYSDVTIAILDTGIDLTHPDLNVDTNLAMNFASGPDANDKNGHGTHVAGTVAAKNNDFGVVGVAQNAKLVPVKVLGNGGSGLTSDIIAGIDYVTGLNQKNPGTIDVINMSLGGSGSCGSYQAAINAAQAVHITTVVAAGNESDDAANHRPANCDNVITVSAIKDTDGLPHGNGGSGDDTFASFSNYGDKVEISAPGVNIYSTWKGGGYNTISGTSMASPHVAGAIAVLKHNYSSISEADVLSTLLSNGIQQTSDVASENGINCSTDPDSSHEPLVYLGTSLVRTGTCDVSGSNGGSGNGSETTTTTATDAYVSYSVKKGIVQVTVDLKDESTSGKSLPVPNTSVTIVFASDAASSGSTTKTTDDTGSASWNFRGVPGGYYTTTITHVDGKEWKGTTHDPGFQK